MPTVAWVCLCSAVYLLGFGSFWEVTGSKALKEERSLREAERGNHRDNGDFAMGTLPWGS